MRSRDATANSHGVRVPRHAAMTARFAAICRAASGAWDDGYVSEYCPRVERVDLAVTQSLRQGAALWFDYGLPRAQYYLAGTA